MTKRAQQQEHDAADSSAESRQQDIPLWHRLSSAASSELVDSLLAHHARHSAAAHGLRDHLASAASLLLHARSLLLALGVAHGLIDAEDAASSLGGGCDGIQLVCGWLPHTGIQGVANAFVEHVHADPHAVGGGGVFLAKKVHYVRAIDASVVGELAGNHLEGPREGLNNQLLLAHDSAGVLSEALGQLQLDGSSSRHDGLAGEGPLHNHDGVVHGPLGLLQELLSATAKDDSGGLRLGAAGEEVVSLVSETLLLEESALTQVFGGDAVHRSLHHGAGGLRHSVQIVMSHTTSAENASIGKVLGAEISNGQAGKHDIGS
mmetsp:Transcript_27796/g.61424  ORF Transcript_27796/g.61424 Transcript_27796/m.61424 type:complete len:319 (+) Transcript_27796:172-1128(+)